MQRGLGPTGKERGDAYCALLAETLNDEHLAAIRLYLQQQRAYGRDHFQAMVEAKTSRFAGVRPASARPRLIEISEPDPVLRIAADQGAAG